MKQLNGFSQVVQLPGLQEVDSGIVMGENREANKTICLANLGSNLSPFVWRSTTLARAILSMALLAFASVALPAQTAPNVTTINGGRNVVALPSQSAASTDVEHGPSLPFFSDFGPGAPYNCSQGYTVSEAGSPVGMELTPAAQFTSAKTGVTASVTVALGWVAGANGARVTLDLDCGGMPCGVDTKYLCRGNVTHVPTFGASCTRVESLKCRAQLVKGRRYWVYVEAPIAPNNTEEGWYLSTTPTIGTFGVSTNDAPWVVAPNTPLPAFSVQ